MLIDFLIGMGAINALPHYLFGRMKIGVLSLFGFNPRGNLFYAAFCMALSMGLFAYKYGFSSIGEHMWYAGELFVVWTYIIFWDLVNRYLRRDPVN